MRSVFGKGSYSEMELPEGGDGNGSSNEFQASFSQLDDPSWNKERPEQASVPQKQRSRRNLMKKMPSRSDLMKKMPSVRGMLKKPSRRNLTLDDEPEEEKAKEEDPVDLVKKIKRERAKTAAADGDAPPPPEVTPSPEIEGKKRHPSTNRRSRLERHQSSAAVLQGAAGQGTSPHARRKTLERTKSAEGGLQVVQEVGQQQHPQVHITRRGGLRKSKTSRRGLLLSEAAASQKSMRNIMVGEEPTKKQKSSRRLQLSENDTPQKSSRRLQVHENDPPSKGSRRSSIQSDSSDDDGQLQQRKGSTIRKPARRGQLRRAQSSRRQLSQQQANADDMERVEMPTSRRTSRTEEEDGGDLPNHLSSEEDEPNEGFDTSVDDIIKQRRKARGAPVEISGSRSQKEHKHHHEKHHHHHEKHHRDHEKHQEGDAAKKSPTKTKKLHRKKSKKFVGLEEDEDDHEIAVKDLELEQSHSKESNASSTSRRSSSHGSVDDATMQNNVDYLQFDPTNATVQKRRGSLTMQSAQDEDESEQGEMHHQKSAPVRNVMRSKSDDYLQFNPADPTSVLKKTGEESVHAREPRKAMRPGLSRASSMNRVARPTVTKSSRSAGTLSMRNLMSSGRKGHLMMDDDMGAIEEDDEPSSSHNNEPTGEALKMFMSSAMPEFNKTAGVQG